MQVKFNLHAKVITGINDHHKAEALFKALGQALDSATRIDERISGRVPSTKDVIESHEGKYELFRTLFREQFCRFRT